jgi:methenyltetrahydromethanopterin cyclohydrolase
MNLNEDSYKTLISLNRFKGIVKTALSLDSKKVVIFDAGVKAKLSKKDSSAVGILTARASTGNLAEVSIKNKSISVSIEKNVAIATLGCQMAGWSINIAGDNAMGSGPARILARKPGNIFEKISYKEKSENAALILESNRIPDLDSCRYIMEKIDPKNMAIATFKGDSEVGLLNVLARVVEIAVYRLNFLGYDVRNIASAKGSVEIPRECDMCSANDALIYNSKVELEVNSWDKTLTEKCVSTSCKSYGQKFKEIYDKAHCDFYRIDESIFAPAKIIVKEINSAKTHKAGK